MRNTLSQLSPLTTLNRMTGMCATILVDFGVDALYTVSSSLLTPGPCLALSSRRVTAPAVGNPDSKESLGNELEG